MRLQTLLALLTATALSACQTTTPATTPATSAGADPSVQALDAPPPQQHLCQPEAARPWLGQPVQADTAERVRAATGAQRARVIRPNTPVTKDLRPYRINLVLDAQGRLQSVYCG